MKNINQQIWKLLEGDLAVQKGLSRGVINTRALAKYLIKRHSLAASLDAVISAIRRFRIESGSEESEKELSNVFHNASLFTRSRLISITLAKKPDFLTKLEQIDVDGHFKLITGTQEFKILCAASHLPLIKTIFEKDVKNVVEDLSAISIIFDQRALEIKGVLARMANEIALHDIVLMEMITCVPELIFYVKEKDLVPTHNILMRLTKGLM